MGTGLSQCVRPLDRGARRGAILYVGKNPPEPAGRATFPSREAVKLEGQATHWDMVGDSGNVKTRGFCPACGSPVYLTFSAMPDLFTIHAASLDDPGRYEPQMVTYSVRGHAWDRLNPAVPKFEKMPPM